MNEHLKQLAGEAGYAAPEHAGRMQRLVELIVKDCINTCVTIGNDVENGNGYEDQIAQWNNHPGPVAWLCADAIAKRFGVE